MPVCTRGVFALVSLRHWELCVYIRGYVHACECFYPFFHSIDTLANTHPSIYGGLAVQWDDQNDLNICIYVHACM